MASDLEGWHPSQIGLQRRFGFSDAVSDRWIHVAKRMPEQHRIFHTSNLRLIPITTVDENGRPWASILTGERGGIGFIESPDPITLSITAQLWDGDPFQDTASAWKKAELSTRGNADRFLTAGLGIEFSTRRRNKFAGQIMNICQPTKFSVRLDINVNQALGNCPKYINVYNLVPFPDARPVVSNQIENLWESERLPQNVIDFISIADTAFVGSLYLSEGSVGPKFSSHAGMNARSGLPGFMRVRPSDCRTIVLPDYSGNRFLSSLGNIEATGLAALTIPSFTTGDVLYMTGTAENLVGQDALKIMKGQSAVTLIKVTGFRFIENALPLRQQEDIHVERSPYSPKVKYLIEEYGTECNDYNAHKAELDSVIQLSDNLAVFRFKIHSNAGAKKLSIRPGQAIVLDFMNWIGPPQYQHMSNAKPSLLNDDRVRTWTVSSAHDLGNISWFELTMREVQGGTVTGALFDLLREANHAYGSNYRPERTVIAEIVGITGEFDISQTASNTLWVAGGIGITPFLSMLSALNMKAPPRKTITLALSTREPVVMVRLLHDLVSRLPPKIQIKIDIFTNIKGVNLNATDIGILNIHLHPGRITEEYWKLNAEKKDALICGPNGFADSAVEGLRAAGVMLEKIHREGFY
ncbi:hypothetical protein N7478_012610 [Penicillium angulare]|uniref:uncharacterized protein n=1 Tax=Penicillium angulare TaxID=116970 RepID=UPI002541D82E|nr:uncharacterized protein N7478_012610 [Penicillium angulare]KAJ5259629.1 hypothetical protein N7478_012610 [Penicillium angulare]